MYMNAEFSFFLLSILSYHLETFNFIPLELIGRSQIDRLLYIIVYVVVLYRIE